MVPAVGYCVGSRTHLQLMRFASLSPYEVKVQSLHHYKKLIEQSKRISTQWKISVSDSLILPITLAKSVKHYFLSTHWYIDNISLWKNHSRIRNTSMCALIAGKMVPATDSWKTSAHVCLVFMVMSNGFFYVIFICIYK